MGLSSIFPKAFFLFLISSPLMLIILSIEHTPLVPANPQLTEEQLRNVQQLLINNDPRFLINSEDQAIELSEIEVNSLLHYFKKELHSLENMSFSTELEDDHIILKSSISVPHSPFGNFINVRILAKSSTNFLSIEALQIGRIVIPNGLIKLFSKLIHAELTTETDYQLFQTLLDSVEKTSLSENQISLTLNWQQDNIDNIQNQVRQLLISVEEQELIIFYQQQLIEITKTTAEIFSTVELNTLTKPLFQLALQNKNLNNDPIIENRAIFIVLLSYLTDLHLEDFTGSLEQYNLETPPNLLVVIEGREDLAQHVIASALISSASSASMANIVSVYKEVHDSRYRSGFSFSDIAANQVGTMIGTASTLSSASAEKLQSLMSQSASNKDFMPLVGTYDGLTEEEFIETYENRESTQFLQRLDDIDQAISRLSFFQQLSIYNN